MNDLRKPELDVCKEARMNFLSTLLPRHHMVVTNTILQVKFMSRASIVWIHDFL